MNKIKVVVYKYNGTKHYQWETNLIEKKEGFIIVKGDIGRQLIHHTKDKIFTIGAKSIEFFSMKEGFTVNIDIDQYGETEIYCNICLPARYHPGSNIISFVDLDLDLLKDKQGNWSTVDEDEFRDHSISMNYPKDIIVYAEKMLSNLKSKIHNSDFPFDGYLEYHIKNTAEENK